MKPQIPKLDRALREAYLAYQQTTDGENEASISITLRFTGDIKTLVALGFELHAVAGDMAFGVVKFRDLPVFSKHTQVLRMSAGSRPKKDLDTAVEDIRARAGSLVSGAPNDGLWHVLPAGGTLSNTADGTGKDVIVAVIDTGIDYTHPAFLKQLSPKRTRILRIWDMGLIPNPLSEAPDPALLMSTETERYGVEYNEAQINAALDGTTPIRHRDCDGHGTHVACIAAGGPLFPTGPHGGDTLHMGVAPEASIIAVKFLDIPEDIFYRTNAGQGIEVNDDHKLYDAVVYCLRTARSLNKPVVVNMSFGDTSKPGDGLDEDGHFLDELMDPTKSEDDLHFPKESILVKSAGNSGDSDDREVVKITVPTSGEVEVPFRLEDTRGTIQTTWEECHHKLHEAELSVDFWYRRTPAPLAVQLAMRLPHDTIYGADVAAGDPPNKLKLGFKVRTGPPPALQIEPTTGKTVHRASLEHEDPGAVSHPAGGTVHRHNCQFQIQPKVVGGTVSYIDGIYWIRIKAPAGTVIFAHGDRTLFSRSDTDYGFVKLRLGDPTEDTGVPPLDASQIEVLTRSSIVDPYGQHVITVAAYDDVGKLASPYRPHPVPAHAIADFSSRGPLRDYSDPPRSRPVIVKPDIAAPGATIEAAESAHAESLITWLSPAKQAGVRFVEHSGTSMSAPMVAGVVATMLDKNRTLNTTQVRTLLNANTSNGVDPAHGTPAHAEAYGSGMIDALAVHRNT